jgi:hypothetical protein
VEEPSSGRLSLQKVFSKFINFEALRHLSSFQKCIYLK